MRNTTSIMAGTMGGGNHMAAGANGQGAKGSKARATGDSPAMPWKEVTPNGITVDAVAVGLNNKARLTPRIWHRRCRLKHGVLQRHLEGGTWCSRRHRRRLGQNLAELLPRTPCIREQAPSHHPPRGSNACVLWASAWYCIILKKRSRCRRRHSHPCRL